jgi:hypothetical protein
LHLVRAPILEDIAKENQEAKSIKGKEGFQPINIKTFYIIGRVN